MKFTGIFLTVLCFYTITGQAQELPINPWAQQNHYVKTSNGTEDAAPQPNNSVQVPLWAEKRAQQIEENNARRREAMIARQKAEQERRRQQAEAEAAANSNDGILEKIGNFFSDSSKPAAQPAPVNTPNDIDWQKEYDAIFKKTPLSSQSLRKLKNSYNRIKNINVDKMINDTMNDLQK